MRAGIPKNESDRLAALYAYDVLDQILDDELEGVVRLSTVITGASAAVVNLIDANRQWQVCAIGMEPGEVTRDDAMCAHTIAEGDLIHVPDSTKDERFVDNPFVTGVIGNVRMYASAPLITSDGYVIGTICTVDDTPFELNATQLDALRDLANQLVTIFELRRNSRRLREANEDLDAFAAVLAHDLRNPLTSVTGFAEILESQISNAGPQAGEVLSRLRGAAGRMTTLIDDVLQYSRSSSAPLHEDLVDLEGLVALVRDNLDALTRERKAKIEGVDLQTITADRSQIMQLLQNLIANAVVHGPTDESAHVVVSTRLEEGQAELVVEDNGPGIPIEKREIVFHAFERADARTRGQGLGLATCKRIVERHGGTIDIEDSSLGGARFVIRIPQRQAPESDEQ